MEVGRHRPYPDCCDQGVMLLQRPAAPRAAARCSPTVSCEINASEKSLGSMSRVFIIPEDALVPPGGTRG